jgi:hypothetical protein
VGAMTKVNINGATHQVEIEHAGADLGYVIDKAQKLWDETKPADKSAPAFGYSTQVKVATNHSSYGPASLGHGDRPVVDG